MSTSPTSLTIDDYDQYRSLIEKSPECRSLLKASLTREIFDLIKNRQTALGGTLPQLISSGVKNLDSSVGVYATDAEAYKTFSPLFDQVISLYHKVGLETTQPPLDFGDPSHFTDVDPERKYVISTRIRCARALRGFPFNPLLTKQQYLEIQKKITDAIGKLPTTASGTYRPLVEISAEEKDTMRTQHFLYAEPDRFLKAANADRFWPEGRGIFYNEDKSVLLWVNEEDQLRIISMEKGADISRIYGRLIETINALGSQLEFERSDRHGASVLIRLPKLGRDESKLRDIAKSHDVQVRGTHGEHSAVDDFNFEISNLKRFGLTEFDAVKSFYDGVKKIIEIESSLE